MTREWARPATEADLDAIDRLVESGRGRLGAQRGGALWLAREAPTSAALHGSLGRDDRLLACGLVDDVVVGYGYVVVEQIDDQHRHARILDLFVEPDARGIGVGESLIGELLDFAESSGCRGIDAVALPGDRATKNFFETHGLVARAIVVHRSLSGEA